MLRRNWHIATLVMLLALTPSAWSQTARYTVPAASLGDDFSSYHHVLDNAADLALAHVVREPAMSSQIAERTTSTIAWRDAEVLRHFTGQYWDGNDEAVRRAVARVMQLRPILTPILREEGVPDEVAAVVLIESAGQATALSPKGARGIWQFMPDTARRYGLAVTPARDDRTDVEKSTRAAARYLRDLHEQFGDWRLAFAAYNAGEQRVGRAVARAGAPTFEKIERSLPQETRDYVPAVMNAMAAVGAAGQAVLSEGKRNASHGPRVLFASSRRD